MALRSCTVTIRIMPPALVHASIVSETSSRRDGCVCVRPDGTLIWRLANGVRNAGPRTTVRATPAAGLYIIIIIIIIIIYDTGCIEPADVRAAAGRH